MFLENQSDILLNLGFTIFREGEGLEWAAMFGGVTIFGGVTFFRGSLLLGFISSNNFWTLLSGRR